MTPIKPLFDKIMRYVGGLKFAVVIIALFVIAMIAGTFIESFYGSEYAGRLLYKSTPFFILQALLLVSILFATILRFPPKERLYGFYIIHIGLMVIFTGAVITYVTGIDGQITLAPNDPTRRIVLPEDVLIVNNETLHKEAEIQLPYSLLPTVLNIKWRDVEVLDYLPFSKNAMTWTEAAPKDQGAYTSSSYELSGQNMVQTVTFSRHPNSEATNHQELGLLSMEYLPEDLAACFSGLNQSDLFFWDMNTTNCFTLKDPNVEIKFSKAGQRMAFVKYTGQPFIFLPDKSPFPLDKELKPLRSSTLRAFSSSLFSKSTILFIFGKQVAFYSKETKKWEIKTFENIGDVVALPWMGFKLKLLNHSTTQYPTTTPVAARPEKKDGEIVAGEQKALKVKINDTITWVRAGQEERIKSNDNFYTIALAKKTIELPFELTLQEFKMDTNPGTKTPASYESYVNLFDGAGNSTHHIFMNNPLKYNRLTFYQSSYFQDDNGQYGSVLSVNFDPGRPIKYLGSFLLVIGCILHYLIGLRRKSA